MLVKNPAEIHEGDAIDLRLAEGELSATLREITVQQIKE
jgi:hypothetical protein